MPHAAGRTVTRSSAFDATETSCEWTATGRSSEMVRQFFPMFALRGSACDRCLTIASNASFVFRMVPIGESMCGVSGRNMQGITRILILMYDRVGAL
ncbi:hypothetical protein BDI4_410026 [Burkholderia diffusa]|nr:hypothetical protein BDI4_410026 [Burkholderia diffusa]